jgi:hypothetical protein
METMQEKNRRLTKEVYHRYDLYLKAYRKAVKHKTNMLLQKEMERKKQDWLEAAAARKMA